MPGVIATNPKYQFSDSLGAPLAGGSLTTYVAGTNTLTNTWQDQAQSTLNTNPILLDARGECLLWLDSTTNYKFVLKNSAGVTQWTVDNVSGNDSGLRAALAASGGSGLVGFLQAGTGAVTRTAQSKMRDVVSVKDFGAVGDGVTDDTAAFNSAIAALKTVGGGKLILPKPSVSYVLTSTLTIQDVCGLVIEGQGASGQTDAVSIVWNGSNGGTMFYINRTRDCVFESFALLPGTGTVNRNLHIDNAMPSGSNLTTNLVFKSIHLGASTTGVYIGGSANNDLHVFDSVVIDGSGTYGYYIDNTQAKYLRLLGGSVGQRTYGIYANSGSCAAFELNFSLNTTDVYVNSPTDTLTFYSCQSENANKFLDDSGASGAGQAITVIGGRLDANNVGGDNIYIRCRKRGPINFVGNDFANGVNRPAIRFDVSGTGAGSSFNSVGNIYPNNTPFLSSVGPVSRQTSADVYVDGTGSSLPMPYVQDTVPRCIGYIQFDGSTGATITSKNLTLTKNSTGDYTLSFVNPPSDALYVAACSLQQTGVANNITFDVLTYTSASFKVRTINVAGGALIDSTLVSVMVMR